MRIPASVVTASSSQLTISIPSCLKAAWFGGTYRINKKASFNFQLAYEAAKTFTAAANVKFTVTPGLVVTPEIAYISWNDLMATARKTAAMKCANP